MPEKTLEKREIPPDLPVPVANPSGKVMDTRKPYTLPLNNRIALTRCIGPYTEIDRKLWATLVALAWDDLDKKSIHETNARDIARLFRELKGTAKNGSTWVMASAKRLCTSRLDWEDEEEEGTAVLLSGLKITKASGAIYYQFSDFLLKKLLDNKRFSRLRLHFMIGLSGKYSVSLYMILEGLANFRHPVLEFTIEELRDCLSVPSGKLSRWIDLYRKAIEPAIKQINDNPVAAGFSVTCEPITRGRKVEKIRLTVTKAAERLTEEKRLQQSIENKPEQKPVAATEGINFHLPLSAFEAARKVAPGWDIYALETEWRDWLQDKPRPDNNAGSFIGFCKSKGRHPNFYE